MNPVQLDGRYVNAITASELLGIARSRMNVLLRDGRVKGAVKFGIEWAIPVPVVVFEHANGSTRTPKIKMRRAS